MEVLFAPMEGLTDGVFRKIHCKFYPGISRYYMPFLSPTMHHRLTPKEQRELPNADAIPYLAVPQIMTKNTDDFLWAARQCAERGYTEINLNAGCPSGTVFSKGKGAGMLATPDALNSFLDIVCTNSPIPISVKTRIGVHSPDELPNLVEIFNSNHITNLILHPRIRDQYYKGRADKNSFAYAYSNSTNPLCFNGDIQTKQDILVLETQFPKLSSVMVGRGLIRYPGMLTENKDVRTLEAYHEELFGTYVETFQNSRNAMHRMKEHWFYLLTAFSGSEKLGKILRKTTSPDEYLRITREIFHTLPYCPE